MSSMRLALALLALAAAAPAAAQPPFNDLDVLRAQQEAAARRGIDQANQLQALEARLRTDQAVANLQSTSAPVFLPAVPASPATPPAPVTSKYPSIPDAVLAESNRRVQAASQPR